MGLRPLLLRPVWRAQRKSFIYCNYDCYNVKPHWKPLHNYTTEVIGGENRHRNLSSRPGFRYRRVMFPGHVYREKVYWWWGQVLEDGTCIDGCDEILPSDPEYTEKKDFILAFKRGEAPGHLLRTRADRSYSSKLGNETKNGPGPRKSGLT